jgi:hypothetical protein
MSCSVQKGPRLGVMSSTQRQCMRLELPRPHVYVHILHCSLLPSPAQALVLGVLVALGLLDVLARAPRVQHVALLLNRACLLVFHGAAMAEGARLELAGHGNGPVSAESLAHVDHALLALGVALLQLLALRREGVLERRPQTLARRVALDHDAVAVLQAEGQRGACGGVSRAARVAVKEAAHGYLYMIAACWL